MKFASIDIGSNTLLLLIGIFNQEGEILPLVEKAEIVRLGEGLNETGQLKPEAMERTLNTLLKFTDLCHRNQVEGIACIGTEALRRASNSLEFIHRIQENCGFKVEIITGKKEAELAYLSANLDFSTSDRNLVVLDIGGGSTELIWEKDQHGEFTRLQMVSMKMGSVRLTEQFIHEDPISESSFQKLSDYIEERIEKDLSPLSPPEDGFTLVGLAGTVTTLASMDQKLEEYDSKKIQGSVLSLTRLEHLIEELKSKNLEDRKRIIGIEPKRADVLLAGALILRAVMKKLKAIHLVVSDRGIRYGLLYQKFYKP
ncbi:MAG: Ppx/GppA family phosphatase [Deltaproteobacteria bacterium]|nr:Ppx/GppA family phosphatase [Deltaproteobacteria bacterium]